MRPFRGFASPRDCREARWPMSHLALVSYGVKKIKKIKKYRIKNKKSPKTRLLWLTYISIHVMPVRIVRARTSSTVTLIVKNKHVRGKVLRPEWADLQNIRELRGKTDWRVSMLVSGSGRRSTRWSVDAFFRAWKFGEQIV